MISQILRYRIGLAAPSRSAARKMQSRSSSRASVPLRDDLRGSITVASLGTR
jgi:hypothetical protein